MTHSMRGSRNGTIVTSPEEQKQHKRKTTSHTLMRVAQSFAPYKIQVGLVLLAIILTAVLGLVNPFMISIIFDDAIGKGNAKLLIILVVIMVSIPVITGLIGVAQTHLDNSIGQNVMRDLRNKLYTHMQSMSLRFFTSTRTGEIQSRLSNDVNGVQDVVTNTATSIISNISTVLGTIIAMLVLSPLLTLISLGLMPLFLWITTKLGNTQRETSKETQESMATLTAQMQETLSVSGILLIKAFGRQKFTRERFQEENERLTKLEIRQALIGRWFFMFIGVFFSGILAIIYLVGGLQIISNPLHAPITLGKIVAFTTLQISLFFPIGQLLNIQIKVQGALALFDRIFEYLDLPIDIQDKANALLLKPSQVRGEVTFDDVSFTYQRDPQPLPNGPFAPNNEEKENRKGKKQHSASPIVLKRDLPERPPSLDPVAVNNGATSRTTLSHVSFTIKPGQFVALVGPSGAGKTTMTYLVPRLHDVEGGAVKIDGVNVKDIARVSLSEIVGMVTQETYLFHASVRENLLYAREDATEEEMIAAAKAAAIHKHIMDLDEGYETIVGERGYKLSGGEKQRIAIARVILKNPRILILDEATSALDTHSERLIQVALEQLMRGRTTIAIAHRLSTILAADVILVVDKGEIVERGTHEELLALNGLYTQLYNAQFVKGRIEEVPAYTG